MSAEREPGRVLVVDDEEIIREMVQAAVTGWGYECVTAANGHEALERAREQPPDVVLLDIVMPGMDGREALRRFKADPRLASIPVVVVSSADDTASIVRCISAGADDFIGKPYEPALLRARIVSCVQRRRAHQLEQDVLARTLGGAISALMDVLAVAHPLAFGRASRVRALVVRLAGHLKMAEAWSVEVAAMLSQLGCIGLSETLLERAFAGKRLYSPETEAFASHPERAYEILSRIPRLMGVADIVRCQGKHYNGGGHPRDGRVADDIPLGARVLQAAVAYDVLRTVGEEPIQAVATMRERVDIYDPRVLDALEAVVPEMA